MDIAISSLSALASLLFAATLSLRWIRRPNPHMILWTLGLLFYFGATGSEFIYEWKGPAASTVKTWYLLGAAFVPAYLGMGTVYLLAPRRWAHSVMALLAAASIYLLVRMITASVDLAPLQGGVPLRSE